jgi:cysteine desulfurase
MLNAPNADATGCYLDHAASSPLRREAREALAAALDVPLGNPSSVHRAGVVARGRLDDARDAVAAVLRVPAADVVFTSGGTESNALALLGAPGDPARRAILTTAVEHPCVLESLASRAAEGVEVRQAKLDAVGRVDLAALEASLAAGVGLVSVQAVNHETGVPQDVAAIAAAAHRHGARLHCDAVAALGKIDLAPLTAVVDLLAVTAHKIGGPPGIGALVVRAGTPLGALLRGGGQEGGRRGGTESVMLAMGFAAAIRAAEAERAALAIHHGRLRARLLAGLVALDHPFVHVGGEFALPHTSCLAFPGIDRIALTINLDAAGIRISPGAACSSGASRPSPVLAALGLDDELRRGAIRVSFGHDSHERDVDALLAALPAALARSRFRAESTTRNNSATLHVDSP